MTFFETVLGLIAVLILVVMFLMTLSPATNRALEDEVFHGMKVWHILMGVVFVLLLVGVISMIF